MTKPGQFVRHPKFGEGMAIDSVVTQGGRRANIVEFTDTKRVKSTVIVISRCPLKTVPPGAGWLEVWDRPRATMLLAG